MSTQAIIATLVLFGSMIVYMVFLRLPVFFSMILACATFGIVFPGKLPESVIVSGIVSSTNNLTFVAVGFYFLLGELLNNTCLGDRLFDFLKALMGHIPGSLSHINIVNSMIFAGVSGSSVADVSSVGAIMIPMMKREGYSAGYSAAVTEVSALIGPIIPPSNSFIACSLVLGCSVRQLFLGGIIPGITMGIAMLVISGFMSMKYNFPRSKWVGWKNVFKALARGWGALALPVFVMVCLLFGIGTVTEIGAVSCGAAIIVAICYRDFSLKTLWKCVKNAGVNSVKILAIVSASGIFSWIISSIGLTKAISNGLMSITAGTTGLVAICLLIFFFMGMITDAAVMHWIIMPLMVPALIAGQVNLIWFGVLASIMINLGNVTPPVGQLIYVSSALAKCSAGDTIKASLPFIASVIAVIVLILFIPEIVLFIPGIAG